MHATPTRIGWALGIVVAGAAIVAWPLATGAGLTLAVAAVYAGVRAAAAVVVLLAVVLVLLAAHLEAGEPEADRPSRSERPR